MELITNPNTGYDQFEKARRSFYGLIALVFGVVPLVIILAVCWFRRVALGLGVMLGILVWALLAKL